MTGASPTLRLLTWLYIGLGVALLAWVVAGIDLDRAFASILEIGWLGLAAVLLIYLAAFYIDTLSWHLAILPLPLTAARSYIVWRIRMVGEAFNTVLPAGGFGGEPIKAVLLKRHHNISYREGTASIILARTINLIGLIVFMLAGLILLVRHEVGGQYGVLALGGFLFLTFGIAVVFGVQKFRATSWTGTRLGRTRLAARIGAALENIREVEDHLHHFYVERPKRFIPAIFLAFTNWVVGAAETYAILYFLGHPVTPGEAMIIESVNQMVRAVTFFVPANLGTQDSILIVLAGAITGVPEAGVALAAIKRLREIVFVLWGFGLGSIYSLRGLMKSAEESAGAESGN
ncbi:MAG: flippase-like domain-containing protein [Rhodospirillales bacterium]